MNKSIPLTEQIWSELPDDKSRAIGFKEMAESVNLPWCKSTGNRIRSAAYRLRDSGRAFSISEGSPDVRWYREPEETASLTTEIRRAVVKSVKSGGAWNVPRLASRLGYLRSTVAETVNELVSENVLRWREPDLLIVDSKGNRL